MTGRAMFNEVFIDDARVPADDIIGGLNNGWAVANTTLAAERAGLGTGGRGAAGIGVPGPDRGSARRRVGDFVGQVRTGGTGGGGEGMPEAAHQAGQARPARTTDPASGRGSRSSTCYSRSASSRRCGCARRRSAGGAPNIAKLMMSDLLRLNRESASTRWRCRTRSNSRAS